MNLFSRPMEEDYVASDAALAAVNQFAAKQGYAVSEHRNKNDERGRGRIRWKNAMAVPVAKMQGEAAKEREL